MKISEFDLITTKNERNVSDFAHLFLDFACYGSSENSTNIQLYTYFNAFITGFHLGWSH